MTKRRSRRPLRLFWLSFGHWGLVIHWSLVIGHWSLAVRGPHWSLIQRQCTPALSPRGEGGLIAALGGSGVVRRIKRPMRILLTRQQREQGSFQDAPTRSPSPRGRGPG